MVKEHKLNDSRDADTQKKMIEWGGDDTNRLIAVHLPIRFVAADG
ncbi:hypothetical protein AAW51_0470 [Caldimonas brevitalea]|uniref:Uncharacterized protein n=1 Tax=Caldimonas brevitalea TaxID=413882 RepID=A0A0G3BIF6_9BURK|nr:hypothetical protein AAW51_0470 [Caldimonas brevitalea]